MPDIIWNYDDIDSNILSVYQGKECIGYFRINTGEFILIEYSDQSSNLNIELLRAIVSTYEDALITAKKMIETS